MKVRMMEAVDIAEVLMIEQSANEFPWARKSF